MPTPEPSLPSETRLPLRSATDLILDLAATTRCTCSAKSEAITRTWLCGPSLLERALALDRGGDHIALRQAGFDIAAIDRDQIVHRAFGSAGGDDQAGGAADIRAVATVHAGRMADQPGNGLAHRKEGAGGRAGGDLEGNAAGAGYRRRREERRRTSAASIRAGNPAKAEQGWKSAVFMGSLTNTPIASDFGRRRRHRAGGKPVPESFLLYGGICLRVC